MVNTSGQSCPETRAVTSQAAHLAFHSFQFSDILSHVLTLDVVEKYI